MYIPCVPLHPCPTQITQERILGSGPIWILLRIIYFITWVLEKCFSQKQAGTGCDENSSEFNSEKSLLRAQHPLFLLQLSRHQEQLTSKRRSISSGTEVKVTEVSGLALFFFSSVQLLRDRGYTVPEEEEKWQEILIHICPKSSNNLGNCSHSCDSFEVVSNSWQVQEQKITSAKLYIKRLHIVKSLALKKCQGRTPEKGNLAGVRTSAPWDNTYQNVKYAVLEERSNSGFPIFMYLPPYVPLYTHKIYRQQLLNILANLRNHFLQIYFKKN